MKQTHFFNSKTWQYLTKEEMNKVDIRQKLDMIQKLLTEEKECTV